MSIEQLDSEAWDRVRVYLGPDLVEYLLAAQREPNAEGLNDKQLAAAIHLTNLFADVAAGYPRPSERYSMITHWLGPFSNADDPSPALSMHRSCRGDSLETSAPGDPLEEALCKLAQEAYPLFLVGGWAVGNAAAVLGGFFRHPLMAAADDLLFQPNEPLMSLFPGVDFSTDRLNRWEIRTEVIWSNGSGGTVSLGGILQAILVASSDAAVSEESAPVSYLESVRKTLSIARLLASGKKVILPARVACQGPDLEEGVDAISLDEGILRRMTPMDRINREDPGRENLVLEIPMEFHLVGAALPGLEPFSPAVQKSVENLQAELQRKIIRARTAILLASKDDETLVLGVYSVTTLNPVTLGFSSRSNPIARLINQTSTRELDSSDAKDIQKWDSLLDGLPSGLQTGQERLLAAVSERLSPHDAFIDAVIVWENLFGHAGDTTLRVCGSLAALLHPNDMASGNNFYSKATDLYGKRSKLVHGGQNRMTWSQAEEAKNRSVRIAIDAWQQVLRTPELKSATTSEERGKLVLVHGVRAPKSEE